MAKKSSPFLIIIDGPMGAGKTTLAEALGKKLPRTAIISLDKVKMMIADYKKKRLTTDLSTASRVGVEMTHVFLKDGFNVVVEKAFTQDKYMKEFLKALRMPKTPTYIYQLEVPVSIAWERVKERQKDRPKKRQQPKSKVVRNHTNFVGNRYMHAKVFNTEKTKTAAMVKIILADIKNG